MNTALDLGSFPVFQPAAVAELGERIRQAAAEGQGLYPVGGRTMLDLGLPPARPGLCVDLRSLNQVIDYPARDMTITVQAGITIRQLQEKLASEHQQLPIDIPRPDQATLGGALATNASGPRRFGHGTLRDFVIGISFMTDEGNEVKAGGRVVKNVAGYDLCKLQIGALGTLGIITQVTLKLRPLPEDRAVVLIALAGDALAGILDTLHQSRTRPTCIDLLDRQAAAALRRRHPGLLPESDFVIVVGFEEKRAAVAWQVQQLVRELPPGNVKSVEARVGPTAESIWLALTEFRLLDDAVLTIQANLLPRHVAAFAAHAAGRGLLIQAHAGNGIVLGHAVGALTADQARTMLTELQQQAVAAGGNLIVLRCPPEWKPSLPIWGAARGDLRLMRAIKDKLDPKNLFNPGRYLV